MKSFKLNGKIIRFEDVVKNELQWKNLTEFELESLSFIKDWLTKKGKFSIRTSGSTGKPKTLTFTRDQLKKSAKRTLETFGLKKGARVLICLDPKFIAGKMMLVRSLEGNLNMEIVTPSLNPLLQVNTKQRFTFAAFFPNQLEQIYQETPQKLKDINTILVGGAAIHPSLQRDLQDVKSHIFHSYATTETLSHQAMRKVNSADRSETFHAIKDVTFDVDGRSCLVITDRLLDIKDLVTNDIVELIDQRSFRWKGRFDNVLNSGGIKIQLEDTEQLIMDILKKRQLFNRFCLVAKNDRALSQKSVLIIEESEDEIQKDLLLKILKEQLPKYHAPKEIILVSKLYTTRTGKIDRVKNTEVYLATK